MDTDRQIRLLIPPFLLALSLVVGAYLDPKIHLATLLRPESTKELFGLLAAAAVCVLPLGFLISVVSVLVLRLSFAWTSSGTYEVALPKEELDTIWLQLGVTRKREKKDTLYAVATYDHEYLSPGIHTWLMRRWNAFNASVHSVMALVLAHIVGATLGLSQPLPWFAFTVVFGVALAVYASMAWRQTMAMLVFQSSRPIPKPPTQI